MRFIEDSAGRAAGSEVDLVVDVGDRIVPVEIKSSATFKSEFLAGIDAFRRVVPLPEITPGAVIYNGTPAAKTHRGAMLANPLDPDFADSILGV